MNADGSGLGYLERVRRLRRSTLRDLAPWNGRNEGQHRWRRTDRTDLLLRQSA